MDYRDIRAGFIEEIFNQMNFNRDGSYVECLASDLVHERLVNQSEVRKMMKGAVNQLTEKFDACIAQVTEELLIGIMKIIDGDRKLVFFEDC